MQSLFSRVTCQRLKEYIYIFFHHPGVFLTSNTFLFLNKEKEYLNISLEFSSVIFLYKYKWKHLIVCLRKKMIDTFMCFSNHLLRKKNNTYWLGRIDDRFCFQLNIKVKLKFSSFGTNIFSINNFFLSIDVTR